MARLTLHGLKATLALGTQQTQSQRLKLRTVTPHSVRLGDIPTASQVLLWRPRQFRWVLPLASRAIPNPSRDLESNLSHSYEIRKFCVSSVAVSACFYLSCRSYFCCLDALVAAIFRLWQNVVNSSLPPPHQIRQNSISDESFTSHFRYWFFLHNTYRISYMYYCMFFKKYIFSHLTSKHKYTDTISEEICFL